MDNVAVLEQFALDNYEAGGHWVYETHDRADYERVLAEAHGDIAVARDNLRRHWRLIEEVAEDIRNA